MSVKERDRLVVVRQVIERELTVTRGAEVLGVSRRQLHRVLGRYDEEGAREEVFFDFGPTLLAKHLGRDPQIGELNPHTLRRWMIEAGLWTHKQRRLRHRRRRERRAAFGEMVQMDTSIHAWLENRSTEEIDLTP